MTHPNPILIDLPMPVVTPRLTIRPVMAGDGVETHAAKIETWDQIALWMPWARTIGTVEETEASIREASARFTLREDLRMVAIERATGRLAVFTGIHNIGSDLGRVEIGFWARKGAQGRGLVTEAANGLARYAFAVLKAHTVCINHAAGNEPSRKVIERLGFQYEGRLRNATMLPDGSLRDQLWYSHIAAGDLPPLDVTWGIDPLK